MERMIYYSTQRPVSVWTYPNGKVKEIHNFDNKTYCEDIGREAYGYIDYDRELSINEIEHWELTPEGMKTYWCVTTSVDDKGRVVAKITSTVESLSKPERSSTSTSRRDIYNDWFDSLEAAQEFAEEAKRA